MILIREKIVGDAVIGTLYHGPGYRYRTLENRKTLIPVGEHKIEVNMSPKFKRLLPLIYSDDIPASRGIRIHDGAKASDSAGCVLVGRKVEGDHLCDCKNCDRVIAEFALKVESDSKLIIASAIKQ